MKSGQWTRRVAEGEAEQTRRGRRRQGDSKEDERKGIMMGRKGRGRSQGREQEERGEEGSG